MSESIMQTQKECYLCGRKTCLERHHTLSGVANRKLSEKYGLWVYLCHDCHTGPNGAQYNPEKNRVLKKQAQIAFEKTHTREEFRKIFGKSYL